MLLSMFAHFLNNMRSLQIEASQSKHNVKITGRAKEDAKLCRLFLKRACSGISMNTIVFRKPTHIYIGDASEHGLGGFSTNHGGAWCYEIPMHLRGRAHINLLEFLVQLVNIWKDVLADKIHPQDCLLGIGDSTTAAGWLRRSNFRDTSGPDEESSVDWYAKQVVARKLAELVLERDAVLYSQWFPGKDNVVTDSLSQDAYFLSPQAHESLLSQTVAHQLPIGFQIQPLPTEIRSFISSTLQLLPVKKQRSMPQKTSELALGNRGVLSSLISASKTHYTSKDSILSNVISSCPLLPRPFEKGPCLKEITSLWWREQSTPPSHMYLRPSGQTIGRTPDWTQTVRHASYCKSNGEHTRTKTALGKNKKPCP